ncbi:MAG: thioredoxin family protein [Thermodesulfobacteriota bacterium]|nr:thioredoxin family protein [Thermodesulfobacteriota bacterium]
MSQEDVTQIKVDKQSVGIMGLKQAMEEMAEECAERPDDEVSAELLKRLSKKNYIPNPARENYEKAFLREFKKFLGKQYDEEVSREVEIKVLGQGCTQCDRLEKELIEVMAELNLAANLEHVRDIKEIGKYGVMGMPTLLINGKVMSVGRVPPRAKIKEWLKAVLKA